MLIVCDFDGTVTARDTNTELARRFAPDRVASIEGKLARREVSVRETLAHEFEGLGVPLEMLVDAALEVPVRDGFRELVERARAAGGDVILLSSGFRQIIEPILEREDMADLVQLLANDIEVGPQGARIRWRDLPQCDVCGEHCKRHEVARLRDGLLHEGRRFGQLVFVGDGFSDRCGADVADRIFARDSLASWLDSQEISWERWDDFHDIVAALELSPSTDRQDA